MSKITVVWDNAERSAIHYKFEGHWSLNDLGAALELGFKLTAAVRCRVDALIDLTHSTRLPEGLLGYAQHALNHAPANRGLYVFVGADEEARAALGVFRSISREFGSRLLETSDLDDARALLRAEHLQVTYASKMLLS